MFCPNCGTEVENGAAFCPSCGTRLKQPPTETAEPKQEQQKPEQKEEAAEPSRTPEYEVTGTAKPAGAARIKLALKTVSLRNKILLLIAAVVFVLLLPGGLYALPFLVLLATLVYFLLLRQHLALADFGNEFSVQLPQGKTDAEWTQYILDEFEYPVEMKKMAKENGTVELKFKNDENIFGKAFSVEVTVQGGTLKTKSVIDDVDADATSQLKAAYTANEVAQAMNYFANGIRLPADFLLKQKQLHKDEAGKVKNVISKICLIAVAVAFIWLFMQMHDSSKGVKDSYLKQLSTTTTVGDALDSFYSNGKWSNYKEKGTQYVVYKGKQKQYGLDISLTFKLEDDEFSIEDSTINGEDEGIWGAALLLGAGYGDDTCKMVLTGTYSDEQTAEQEIYKIMMEAAASEDAESQPDDGALSQYLDDFSPDYNGDYSPDDTPADDSGDSTGPEAMTNDGGFADGALDYNYIYKDGVIVPDVGDAGTYGIDITTDCVLKAGPGVGYDDVRTVYAGETAVAIFTDGDWLLISDENYTSYGWIPVAYQKPNRPD